MRHSKPKKEVAVKKETKNSQGLKEKLEKKVEEPVVEIKDTAKVEEASKPVAEVKTPAVDDKEGKVGLLLKEVRLKQGKSLPEISQELCIRKVYLAAIEDSDYDNIPEYPYGIGFIRSYADYLGLDGVNIVQMYKEEAEANFRKNNPYFVIEPQVEATVPSKKYLIISLLAVIAVYFAWSAYNHFNNMEEDNIPAAEAMVETDSSEDGNVNFPLKVEDYSTSSESNEAAAPVEEALPVVDATNAEENNPQVVVKETSFKEPAKTAEPAAAPVAEPAAETKPAKSEKGLSLSVKKDTWVEVKNDSKLYLSKVLMPGDTYVLPNDTNLKLSVGKSDGVEVLYNGKQVYTISPNKKMNISVDDILAAANH